MSTIFAPALTINQVTGTIDANRPRIRVFRSGTFNLGSVGVFKAVDWDAESTRISKVDLIHDNAINPARVIVATSGSYSISACVQIIGGIAVGNPKLRIVVTRAGSSITQSLIDQAISLTSGLLSVPINATLDLNVGDQVTIEACVALGLNVGVTNTDDSTFMEMFKL